MFSSHNLHFDCPLLAYAIVKSFKFGLPFSKFLFLPLPLPVDDGGTVPSKLSEINSKLNTK